jgi:hypothetical protein
MRKSMGLGPELEVRAEVGTDGKTDSHVSPASIQLYRWVKIFLYPCCQCYPKLEFLKRRNLLIGTAKNNCVESR